MTAPLRRVAALLCLAAALGGCAYYSFTGAAIPAHQLTIAIPPAEDQSASPIPTLADNLTRLLTERFVGQTRLTLQPDPEQASVVLEARIERYDNTPTSVTADERAELNRVTIIVAARYFDRVEDRELMQRQFQGFGEFNPSADGLEGELRAAREALRNIADDVFSGATSNW